MRLVADTNLLVSAVLWNGAPRLVLQHVRSAGHLLFASPALVAELEDVLFRPKLDAAMRQVGSTPRRVFEELQMLLTVVHAQPLESPVCRDPDDDAVLACAVAARAELIVSGDRDLLDLGSYAGISIVRPSEALERIS